MVVTRNLKLLVKKNAVQLKTMEGSLEIIANGERSAMSKQVAELNTLLPQYLGVSKAILDTVIFCHQDESLWPMSEPAPLKKRFDEIFEALKYTKAIDNIKDLKKKQGLRLSNFKKDEEHCKMIKASSEKVSNYESNSGSIF